MLIKVRSCMQDIIGARFHCAICDDVDICANCESAGLPGNMTSTDGGHNYKHIMIKVRQNAALFTGRSCLSTMFVDSLPSQQQGGPVCVAACTEPLDTAG